MQRTLDNRRIGTEHPVEGNAARRGLCKVNRIALADGELLPVGRHAVAGLGHGQGVAGLTDTTATGNHLAAAGKTGGLCRTHYKQAGGNNRTSGTFATAAGKFGYGNIRLPRFAPDKTVDAI